MSDPISSSLMAKIISGLGGLIGGISFMAFLRPCNVWDASVRSGLSVISAVVFAPILLEWINFNPTSDNVMAASVAIGFCSWSLLSLFSHILIGVQDEKVSLKLPFLERKE
jgi:hypothetical protein